MTVEEAVSKLQAKIQCMEYKVTGVAFCIEDECDDCHLLYEQGNVGEQIECLRMAIKALKQEPCKDAISRILKRMWNCRGEHTTSIDKVKMEQIIRDELLSVTPKPKTGHWIDKDEKSAVCSCCNKNNILYGDFCKWCGAKMVESQGRSD